MSPNRPPQGDVPPVGGGLPPPRQIDQAYRPGSPTVVSPQTPQTLRAELVILSAQNTGYSGMFAYAPAPGAGNLVFSVSAVAGTDPWGNSYPAGVSLSTPGSVLQGDDYILNTAGLFYYDGAPQLGNLIMSLAAIAGTDTFGNPYPQGLAVGAVTVGTGAVHGSNIVPGSIDSGGIAQGAIVAGLIAAGAIDGMTLTNVTINGQTVSGCNVEVSAGAGGIYAYGSPPTVTQTFDTAGGGSFTVPSGVTSVTAETWGGGGGGAGQGSDGQGGPAGGGGGYATATISGLTGGQTLYYGVGGGGAAGGSAASGVSGNPSWVNTSNTQTGAPSAAAGGQGGQTGTGGGTGGTGGTVTAGTGHSGGAGHAGTTKTVTTVLSSGSGSWTVPPGVTSVSVQCWGAGAGGAGGVAGTGGADTGGEGGGGGGWNHNPAYPVTPGASIAYSVGGGGARGAINGLGSNGGDTSWDSGAIVGGGGKAATLTSVGLGGVGSGSSGTGAYHGGNGGSASSGGGSGGGGAGGSTGYGGNAPNSTSNTGSAGGAGNDGGGNGGSGGNGDAGGLNGHAPGGGGGGGGYNATGGYGADGQIVLTYTLDQAGGGGSSAGTAAAGNAGAVESGGTAVSGGGPGGGVLSGMTWTAAPSSGPGGGGGGYDSYGAAGAGATGQVRLTYAAGTPSLIGSWVAAAGTDPQTGTSVPAGIKVGNIEATAQILLDDVSSRPATPSGAGLLYGVSGFAKALAIDGLPYNLGHYTMACNATPQTISSTTMTTVSGMSCNLVAAEYHIRGSVLCQQGGSSVAQKIQVSGPSTNWVAGQSILIEAGTGKTANVYFHASLPSSITTPAWAANAEWLWTFDLLVSFSAAGTLAVQGAEGTSGDTWSVLYGAVAEVVPVSY